MPIEVPDPEHGTPGCPLRIAVLVKQVPVGESLTLGPDGRLQREDGPLEMNPYCRRAVSKGVELARATGGICTVFTMGPDSASDVLREAVAWGADTGVHLCDPAFAGSDTLATARALTAALSRNGPFDLIVVGRNTVDGETGQVGPELAQLLDLPFAAGVRQLELTGRGLSLGLEQDDGWTTVELALPALISAAERLCEPCKVGPEGRAAVAADRIVRRTAAELGAGPWGQSASPTWVGAVRVLSHERLQHRLSGPVSDQVREAVAMLEDGGPSAPAPSGPLSASRTVSTPPTPPSCRRRRWGPSSGSCWSPTGPGWTSSCSAPPPGWRAPRAARWWRCVPTASPPRTRVVSAPTTSSSCGASRWRRTWPRPSPAGPPRWSRGWCWHRGPPSVARWRPARRPPWGPVSSVMPSACTPTKGVWSLPNRPSPERWLPTSPALRRSSW